MARTIAEIEADIIAVKDSESALNSLNSTSKTAIWRLWIWVCAAATWLHEKTDDLFRSEIEELVDRKQATTLAWYRSQFLNYLHGKAVVWNDKELRFEQTLSEGELAEDFKLVDYCAVVRAPRKVLIKVAKDDNSDPIPLSAPELTGLKAFGDLIQLAGDNLEYVNRDPDQLQLVLDVYVDPTVIDVTTGALHVNVNEKPARQAAYSYLRELEFNGAFVLNSFLDSLQSAEGIVNPVLRSAKTRFGANPFLDIDVEAIPDAGHFTYQTLTLNYIAKV